MTSEPEYQAARKWDLETYELTRRRFVQRVAGLGVGASLAGLLAACGGGTSGQTAAQTAATGAAQTSASGIKPASSINFVGYEGYALQPWLDEFKQKTGITVNNVNTPSPADQFAKMKANPDFADVTILTAGWSEQLVKNDLIVPIDTSRVANVANISASFDWKKATTVNGTNYAILYNWGLNPLGWNADKVPGTYSVSQYVDSTGLVNSWNILWDPQFKGLVSIFDDPTSVEPMIPLALGFPDPYNLDAAQFDAFTKKLLALQPQVKRLTEGMTDQASAFTSGEAVLGCLNAAQVQAVAIKQGVNLVVNNAVKEGMQAYSDNFCIVKRAAGDPAKVAAIYTFINEALSVPWQARFVGATGYTGVLSYEKATSAEAQAAGLTAKALSFTPLPDTQKGQEYFKLIYFYKPVEDLQKRIDVWNQFKLGVGA